MTGKRNETRTTDLNYPMVDLLTGGIIMPLMYVNTLAVCCLLPLTSPWLFMQAWAKGLQDARASGRMGGGGGGSDIATTDQTCQLGSSGLSSRATTSQPAAPPSGSGMAVRKYRDAQGRLTGSATAPRR
jgi:hypothetical protein